MFGFIDKSNNGYIEIGEWMEAFGQVDFIP